MPEYSYFGKALNVAQFAALVPTGQISRYQWSPSARGSRSTGTRSFVGCNLILGFRWSPADSSTGDRGLADYTDDAEHYIKTVNGSSATYSYGGAGLRVVQVVGGTTTVYTYSGTNVIPEYANGPLSKENIYSGSSTRRTSLGSHSRVRQCA